MRNQKGLRGLGATVGGPSIVMIFVVLALTTFGTLAMLSARADLRFAQRTADTVTNYYRADLTAQARLAELDAVLADAHAQATASPGDEYLTDKNVIFYNIATGLLLLEDQISMVSDSYEHSIVVSYGVPISEGKQLYVELNVGAFDAAERYTISTWQVHSETAVEEDEDVQLLDPSFFDN